MKLDWDAVDGAKAYLIHYADANETDKHKTPYMGYSETNSWTLATKDVPTAAVGDKLYFYIQTYNVKVEDPLIISDVDKARYLHDGDFIGSAWSDPIILTKA